MTWNRPTQSRSDVEDLLLRDVIGYQSLKLGFGLGTNAPVSFTK